MGLYPVFLDLKQRPCLVVGGGRVALRKAIGLLRAGASVTVVALSFDRRFARFARRITMCQRAFRPEDINGSTALVIGATDIREVNALIAARARQLTIPCNIVDQPDLCSFIVPAVVRRGKLSIAVSTGGASPMLARVVKTRIAQAIGAEYGELAELLAGVRVRIAAEIADPAKRAQFWRMLFDQDPVVQMRTQGRKSLMKRIEQLIQNLVAGESQ